MSLRWTPERLDQLENAARNGRRVALARRGSEYVVIAVRMTSVNNRDAFVGRLPMTGEEMTFVLNDVEYMQVLS
ncbi:MAG TPA: hypothetical protein VG692_12765 [Gemmatimonadales bacterium]|nr:hypothetical protein [Gemmatimonadales bacterium]